MKSFVDYLAALVEEGEEALSSRVNQIVCMSFGWNIIRKLQSLLQRPHLNLLRFFSFEGFILRNEEFTLAFHLLTDSEIFGWERPQPRTRQRPVAETPELVYADLQVGDYVVHIDHGVGRFGGLVQRELDGHMREFLAVEYDGGGQLYVPVHQADRLTRYIGAEGAVPALDRLGGQEWQEKKGRVKQAVIEVAQDMLDLYARRNVVKGYAFKPGYDLAKRVGKFVSRM